ncbi:MULTISPECIES: hypothetical protein [unclassified Caballeronia]|uniref:hypothetical protein n=1 Tax=unclassified Caballeronia TaxID=2646786 RepID=UPI002859D556|nr:MULTISPECIES: hypothetical protein [unclassified Caballeronia]MDR5739456.1 hypothetical protein [Caballeronia sp. LZ016]MDR5807945.1 hypothetical protein [Caballeronia sp. LZ019]
MSTLSIHDLAHHAEMNGADMSAVRGGMSLFFPSYNSSYNLSANTQQLADQAQQTFNVNGVNDAFAHDIKSRVEPQQKARNDSNINVFTPYAM